jgi:hypothetical protein
MIHRRRIPIRSDGGAVDPLGNGVRDNINRGEEESLNPRS